MCGEQDTWERNTFMGLGKSSNEYNVFLPYHFTILTPLESNIWIQSEEVYVCIWWIGDRKLTLCKKSVQVTGVDTENVLMHQWRWIIVNSTGALALVSTCCCLWLATAYQLPHLLWTAGSAEHPAAHMVLSVRAASPSHSCPSQASLPSWPCSVEKDHQQFLPSSH